MCLKPEQTSIPVAQIFISILSAELGELQEARDMENDQSYIKIRSPFLWALKLKLEYDTFL